MDDLRDTMLQGWIDWAAHGHFHLSLVKAEDDKTTVGVNITYKAENKTGAVANEVVENDDWTTVKLKSNHSICSAFLETASGDTYTVKSLFPHFFRHRVIKRQNSDNGITSKVEAAPCKIQKKNGDTGGTSELTPAMALPVGIPPADECKREVEPEK